MKATSKAPIRLLAAVAVLFLLVGCGSDDGDDATNTPNASAGAPGGSGSDDEFCRLNSSVPDQTDPDYFGSSEHIEQLRAMAEVAPDAIAADIELVVEHFEQGVEPVDPDDVLGSLPDDVAAAVNRAVNHAWMRCL